MRYSKALRKLHFVIVAILSAAFAPAQSASSDQQTWSGLLPFLSPEHRSNVIYIDSECGLISLPNALSNDVWQAPSTSRQCYLHHTGEKFTLRKLPVRPMKPLLFAPEKGATPEQIQDEYGSEFNSNSGPYRRVLSRLPTPHKPGYAYMSFNVALPSEVDIREQGDDNACIYCGGWGGHGGAVDAGFVHSKARHDWAFFVRRQISVTDLSQDTGETFSLRTRYKEGQTARLTLYVPKDNKVAVNASGLDEKGAPMSRTMVVAIDPEFQWRSDGRANILKRIVTIAQEHENFAVAEKVEGVHWFSPTATDGPGRIGWNWKNNHDWAAKDSVNEGQLRIFEIWPTSYVGRRIVFVDEVGPGEETDAIITGSGPKAGKP